MADRYALVVGIAEYKAFTRLEKVPASVLAIAHILQKQGQFRVDLDPVSQWIDAETPKAMGTWLTGSELWQKLETFFQNTAQGGDALFYFCGHGFIVRDRYNPSQQEAYLATSDTTVTLENGQVISQERGISFQNLVNLFSQSHLRSLVVLLDCCHAGSLLEESVVENFLSNPNRDCSYRMIAACRAFESAYESSQQYTIFTDALIKSLAANRADEDGQISDGRAWEFLQRTLRGRVQKPVSISLRDSIILVTYNQPEKLIPATNQVRSDNPYIGLLAFEEADADRFFGRDNASWDLLNDLRDNSFLAVVGDSGSGKSSLVKAGLLPKLRTGQSLPGSDQWQIEPMTPGRNPDVRLQAILVRYTEKQPLLVFIDQFEEVFTQCDDEAEKRAFMRRITKAVTQPEGPIRFVVTIRGDFLSRCGEYEIADLINASKPRGYIVKAMTRDELRDAIEKPASRYGVQFEAHLVDQIIEDVESQPGALPLLQHALKELWRLCIEANQLTSPTLTWLAYEQIGGVAGALEKRADHLYNSFSTTEQAFTRRLFVQELVRQEGQTYTRRRGLCSSLEKIAPSKALLDRVIDGFTGDRLLVTGILPQTSISQTSSQPQSFVEIAHEALLEKWTRLKTWLQEDREKIDLLQQLRTNFDNWKSRYQQSDGALLMGALLANIEEKLEWQDLEPEETAYVRKSLEHREQERREKLRKERQRWMLAAGLLCMSTFSSLFLVSLTQEKQVEVLTRLTENQIENHQQLQALITSIQGLNALNSSFLKSDKHIRKLQTIISKVQERNQWSAHSGGVFGMSINFVDNKVNIVSSGRDGKVKLWTSQGQLMNVLDSQNSYILNVKSSRDKKLLASTGTDGKVRLQDLANNVKYTFPGHSGRAYGISFRSDDSMLVSSGSDGTLKLWSTITKQQVPSIILQAKNFLPEKYRNQPYKIYGVDFSLKNKNLIAYGGEGDYSIWLWDSKSATELPRQIGQHEGDVVQVQFTPDGMKLVTCSNDGMIKVWPINSSFKHQPILQIKASQKGIYSIDIGKDKNNNLWLVSGGEDQAIRVWNLEKAIQTYRLTSKTLQPDDATATIEGYNSSIYRVQFATLSRTNSPNQPTYEAIISASDDGKIHLWEWRSSEEVSATTIDQMKTKVCTLINDYLNLNPIIRTETEISCP
jgi:WD40 repeat protein/energy-coupling factor transporter ATP-binding protein EcfA2